MMRRDRMLRWSVGLAAVLLPGCLSDRPRLTPAAQEKFDKAGQQEVRGADPSPVGPGYDRRDSPPAPPPMPSVDAGPQTPPSALATPAAVPMPLPQPAPAALSSPPVPPPPSGGSEPQAVVQAGARSTLLPPPAPEPPLLAAMRCYREGRNDEARKHLQTFDSSTRALLERLLLLVAGISNGNLDKAPPRQFSALVQELDALAQLLRPRAELEIKEVRFCQRIRRFGDYDPLPADHAFQAGAGDRPGDFVQVYVELRNFTCCKHGPFYETALASSVTIRDASRRIVCPPCRRTQVDRLLSRRLDCFLNCHFYVPAGLPPGEYQLAIEVKDVTGLPDESRLTGQRVAQQVVPFRVSSPAYAGARWENSE